MFDILFKKIATVAVTTSTLASAHLGGNVGVGTVPVLDQFTATTSPATAITQRTYGKSVMLTGLTTGQCLTLDSNGVITTTSCGSGGGSTFGKSWEIDANNYLAPTTTITVKLNNGFVSQASSTVSALLSVSNFLTTGSSTLQNFTFKLATGTSATTTNFFATTASSTNLFGAGLLACSGSSFLQWSSGIFSCGTPSGSGTVTSITAATPNSTLSLGGTNPVTTSGTINFDLNLAHANLWTASTTFVGGLSAITGTTTFATSTSLSVSSDASIPRLSNLATNGFVKTGSANGTLSVDTSTYLTGNQTITLSGVVSGSGATSIVTSFTTNPLAWSLFSPTILQPTTTPMGIYVQNSTSTITNLSMVNSTSTNATTTSLAVTAVKSALVLNDSNGVLTSYGGAAACTNQVVTALSATGASTCTTVANAMLANSTISGVALGGTLAALTATDNTLTFSGSYTGNTARTVGIALGNGNIWTAASTTFTGNFNITGNSTTTNATTTTSFATTASSTNLYSQNLVANIKAYPSFTYATSSAWTGTTTIPLGPAYVGEIWNGVACFTDAGTLNVDFYYNSTHIQTSSTVLNASTTVNVNTFSTNTSLAALVKRYVDVGTPASSPTKISCTISRSYASN